MGWCAQPQQKCQHGALRLIGREFSVGVLFLRIPGGTVFLDLLPRQKQLPIGKRTHPHPVLSVDQIGRTVAVETHVLLQETEQMLNGKTP